MKTERVYTPGSVIRTPQIFIYDLLQGINKGFFIGWTLFATNTNQSHRKTLIGVFWVVIPPIILSYVFFHLHSGGVLRAGTTHMPYQLYVLTGLFAWQNFALTLESTFVVISRYKTLISGLRFDWESLIFVVLFECGLRIIIQIPIILVLASNLGNAIDFQTLSFVLPNIGLALLGSLIGCLITPLRIVSQDFSRLINFIMRAAFFMTPIIYVIPKHSFIKMINDINPVTPFIEAIRNVFSGAPVQTSSVYIILFAVSVLGVLISCIVYRMAMPIMIERMGNQ